MNENMSRLKDLIGEVNKTVQNLEAETKEIRQKNIAEREKQFRHMVSTVLKCKEVSDHLINYTSYVKLKSLPYRNTDRYYHFSIYPQNDWINVYIGKDCFTGSIPFDASYEGVKNGNWHNSIGYDIDAILDAWDDADFEAEFAKEVERILTVITEKANANYEAAKRGEI